MPYPLPPTLSPSRVTAFTDCALAYRFANLDRLPEPPSPHAIKGTLVHAALERLFCLPAPDRTPAAASACLAEAVEVLRDDEEFIALGLDDDGAAAFVADAERLLERYFAMEDPTRINAVGIELRLEAEVGGVSLRGIIDRLDRNEDGSFTVVDYKGLALDTPLPSPTGWTTMAEVEVGDEVLAADGSPTKVTGKSRVHHRPCYRIAFSDGSSVVCDNVHLWNVRRVGAYYRGDRSVRTLDADALYAEFSACRAEGTPLSLVVDNPLPIELPDRKLPVDPWLLGAWLGDGRAKAGEITVGLEDQEWMTAELARTGYTAVERVEERSVQVTLVRPRLDQCPRGHSYDGATRSRGLRQYRVCSVCRDAQSTGRTPIEDHDRWNVSLTTNLRALGVLHNKHVPVEYLRASVSQRLALLQGLMDTDGHWHSGRCRAVFTTTSAALAAGVRELVHSFGLSSSEFVRNHANPTRPDVIVHHVEFRPVGINPFRLPRKASQVDTYNLDCARGTRRGFLGHALRRSIVDVSPVPSVPTQCIEVDAPDSLYLCGSSMVPTHNSGRAPSERYEKAKLLGVDAYALLIERTLGVLPAAVRLLYLSDGIAITCTPSAQNGRFIEKKVEAIWSTIQRANATDSFKPKPGRLCDWCAFQSWCPSFGGDPEEARALGEQLRAERRAAAGTAGTLTDLGEPLPFGAAAAS